MRKLVVSFGCTSENNEKSVKGRNGVVYNAKTGNISDTKSTSG